MREEEFVLKSGEKGSKEIKERDGFNVTLRRLVAEKGLPLGIRRTIRMFGGDIGRVLDSEDTQKVINSKPV